MPSAAPMLEVLTIFLGAFLVFLVQPLVGNVLLPVFGGTAAVWSACLAAFQMLLVGGYFYAHVTGRPVGGRRRRLGVHAALLFAATGWLFHVALNHREVLSALTASDALPPALGALLCIAVLVAGPYVLLSSNSSLVQVLSGGKYKLYAVSNIGSMLGLLAYPFVFEPFFSLSEQWLVFAGATGLYAVLFTVLLLRRGAVGSRVLSTTASDVPQLHSNIRTFKHSDISYFLLSFVSCYLLNAVSTHLCTNITPLPMLWAGLLAVYLLSYILAFTDLGARTAPWMGFVVVPFALFGGWHLGELGISTFVPELTTGLVLLFFGGWIVHARLYRRRPSADGLTRYYLMIALGGAVGGATSSFLMSALSDIVAEYPIALALALGVVTCDARDALVALIRRPACRTFVLRSEDPQLRRLAAFIGSLDTEEGDSTARHGVRCAMFAVLAAFAAYGVVRGHHANGTVLCRYRNFYGVGFVSAMTVKVDDGSDYRAVEFVSNGTAHGRQVGEGDWRGCEPTAYYAEHAGGLAIVGHPKRLEKKPMRIALCGLGIGTLAAYAQEGDFCRFYEINPAVVKIARDERLFTFLSRASGKVEVILDDARRALSREAVAGEPRYDVLVVDVFNGDAIPPHMATKEAFRLYLDRLDDKGILAVHISNWHLDLAPMAKAAARELGLNVEVLMCRGTRYASQSCWVFLSRAPLSHLYDRNMHARVDLTSVKDIPLMEDDRHSLLPYLRLNRAQKGQSPLIK